MIKARLIVGNLIALGTGEFIDRLLAMLLTVYLARVLGPATFGVIGIALTMNRFGMALTNGGTYNLGARTVARDPNSVPGIYGSITGFRLLAALVIFAAGIAILPWVPGWLGIPRDLMLLYLVAILLHAFALTWLFSGLEKMHLIAGVRIVNSAIALVATVALVHGAEDILRVPIAMMLAAALVLFWCQHWAHKRYGGLRINLEPRKLLETARESVAVSFSGLFTTVNLQGTVLFLGLFATDVAMAGEFLASQRVVLTLYGLTLLLPGAAFPATARLVHADPKQAADLQDHLVRINLTLMMPLVFLCAFYADAIVGLLYGDDYAQAAMVLKLMVWTVPIAVINTELRHTLLAAAAIRAVLLTAAIGAAVHVFLAWMLIPEWSLRGAVAANIAGLLVLMLSAVVFVRGLLGRFPAGLRMLGPMAAGVAGYLALTLAADWPWLPQITLGVAVYAGTALLTRAVTPGELKTLIAMVPGKNTERNGVGDS